jgi:RimJ/RimL family protein N-acetyltransferase
MSAPLLLPTEREPIVLRQLVTEDAPAYFEAVDANREHLSKFGDETATKYPDIKAVEDSLTSPSNPNKLRMGIWDGDTFVGTVNATPDDEGAEIGYWLDARQTGKGYATLATKALSNYVAQRYSRVYAEVVEGNEASARVLERAGFRRTATEAGKLIFELLKQEAPRKISLADTTHFDRDGFSGNIYVPKEAKVGFNALKVDVHGRHPRKRMLEGTTRTYYVSEGEGTFTLGNETHTVAQGDLFVIPPNGEYEYAGTMTLLEFNVSPDNSFRDEKLV